MADVGLENALSNINVNIENLEVATVNLTGANVVTIMTSLTNSNGSLVTIKDTLTSGNSSLVTIIETLTSANANMVKVATAPIVYNVVMTTADTEYTAALSANTKMFTVKLRSNVADLKLCYSAGASGLTYLTIPAGSEYEGLGLLLASTVLYLQSPTASQTAEIVEIV